MQALHRVVILQAKCAIRIQALCLLYLSHPPETGNGGKRSFDKGSDEEEKNVFWYLAFLSYQYVKASATHAFHVQRHALFFPELTKPTHVLPVPVHQQTDFTPKRVVISHTKQRDTQGISKQARAAYFLFF